MDPLTAWGYPAYDGVLCAWLGGFCGTDPSAQTFCQDLFIDGMLLDWYWMGYVSATPGMVVQVTVNGNVVFTHAMLASEHTYGTWNSASSYWGGANVSAYCGQTVNLCFKNLLGTDNMLVDYVTLNNACDTATEASSISTVKALY